MVEHALTCLPTGQHVKALAQIIGSKKHAKVFSMMLFPGADKNIR